MIFRDACDHLCSMGKAALHDHIEKAVIRVIFFNKSGTAVQVKIRIHAEAAAIGSITGMATGKCAAEVQEWLYMRSVADIFIRKNNLLRLSYRIIIAT